MLIGGKMHKRGFIHPLAVLKSIYSPHELFRSLKMHLTIKTHL